MNNSLCALMLMLAVTLISAVDAQAIEVTTRDVAWQQVEPKLTFHFFIERELYTNLDRTVRMVFAAETGDSTHKLAQLRVQWSITSSDRKVSAGSVSLEQGGADVTFPVTSLTLGRFNVSAKLMHGEEVLAEKSGLLRVEHREVPGANGSVSLRLPRGVPLVNESWPVHAGVPFPKGVLWDARHVRVVDGAGNEVDADVTVRSRWDSSEHGSVRWLGVQFQPGSCAADWPEVRSNYRLEYGQGVKRSAPKAVLRVTQTDQSITIDTGAATLRIDRQKFNVIDQWRLKGGTSFESTSEHGLYVVDHQGTTYRAANDGKVEVSIEEQSAMHVVVTARGWYVKDNVTGEPTQHYELPTEKLCRFVTRIEAYAGKTQVRVVNTLILTFDTFTVRLLDAGMSLPMSGAKQALFGVEDGLPVRTPVPATGVRGMQHMHDAYTIENGQSETIRSTTHSAGWVIAQGASHALALSLRDTWQRYPKEFEVLPDALKLHVWPAHGREHPHVNELARDQIHRLLFAHQGRELNLTVPWDYYIASVASQNADKGGGVDHVLAAVESTAMGVATTSDVLLELGASQQPDAGDETNLIARAQCFQTMPSAIADPKWTCDSLALGYIHPHDPKTFPQHEQAIWNMMHAYVKYQNLGQMYGMWIYRSWLHSAYWGKGVWDLYRLYNASHHHEAVLPWMLFARSGDPFYLDQGMGNIRQFTDVQMVHHADDRYPHVSTSAQRLMVGTTRHVCFVPWGWDQLLLGHQTSYNALIMAYYITGDLRLREVVADQWLPSLLGDRNNPQYAKADLSGRAGHPPRNNSIAIGEIIDAYQLTYDPRLLILLAPRHEVWTNQQGNMGSDWGQPLHNEWLFRQSEITRQRILAGAQLLVDEPQSIGRHQHVDAAVAIHSPQEILSLAQIVDPENTWAMRAMSVMKFPEVQAYGWNLISEGRPQTMAACGERVLFMPRLMHALTLGSHASQAAIIGRAMPAVRHWEKPMRVVFRKDTDEAFEISINGQVTAQDGMKVQVFDPAGTRVLDCNVPLGLQSMQLKIPADGKTGQYVMVIEGQKCASLFAPFTLLPEVYVVDSWTSSNQHQRYFTRAESDKSVKLHVTPSRSAGTILSADQSSELFNSEDGQTMTVDLDEQGVWLWNRGNYMSASRDDKQPVILSVTPQRWFMPTKKAMSNAFSEK